MRNASKLAIVEKLLPLLEAYGASRAVQTECRQQMKASACTHQDREVTMPSLLEETRVVPCYDSTHGRTPWCEACRRHDGAFARLMAERKLNKKRLHKITRLAVALAEPEPPESPERRELFELLHELEQEDRSADTADVRERDNHESRG